MFFFHKEISILATFFFLQTTCEVDVSDIIRNIDSAFASPSIDFNENPPFKKEYDFIIIGCGAGGALTANRLSEVPSFQVLCIDAGDKENYKAEEPLTSTQLLGTSYDWKYTTAFQKGICAGFVGEVCAWPSGKALGGSTVINGMSYTRGNRRDFNIWASRGAKGWSFKEVLPYFKKFENFQKLDLNDTKDFGLDGEIDIEYPSYQSPILPDILKSIEDLGIPYRNINGKSQVGVSHIQAMLRNGRRLSATKAFLFPIKGRRNLHIAKNTFTTKIIINPKTKTAVGVEVYAANKTYSIKARKEVILSAGTINSAKILMLSGIGPKKHLNEMNIELIEDLPVGRRLQDHVRIFGVIFTTNGPKAAKDPNAYLNYLLFGRGIGTVPEGMEAYLYVNARNDSFGLPNGLTDVELEFSGIVSGQLKQVGQSLNLKKDIYDDIFPSLEGKDGFMVIPSVVKPKSIGNVELASKDPFVQPNIYSNYFQDESDLETLLCAIRLSIKIALGKPLQKYNVKLHKFKLKPCSQYQFNSDNFWKCLFKLLPSSEYHPVGTCKMGSEKDRSAVVDPQLRVKGIKRLRVVDASVMPEIPSAHTTACVYMIAEKAVDIIKEAHGVN